MPLFDIKLSNYEASKSVGYYWKKNLVSAEIIKTERQFKFLRKGTL